MTSLAPPLPDVQSETRNVLPAKLAITLGLAALADWLFYDQRIGISMTIFAIALFAGSWLGNLAGLNWRRTTTAALVLFVALVPAVEELNGLTFLFIVAGLAYGISILTNPDLKQLFLGRLGAFRDLYLIGPFRLAGDLIRMLSAWDLTGGFAMWLVPIIFGAIFVLLFASANPLIERWISLLDPKEATSHVNLARTLFWVFVLSVIWPFIHVRWRRKKERTAAPVEPVADNAEPRGNTLGLFGKDAILRSLILFNLLFAVQTVLDAAYLWGNATLPPDVTYASYAHRGAYPLIVTALLAAGFMLAAMRPGGHAEKSPVIRPLLYLWVAQNVMMVASCILRLHLYVETYLLTMMRVAAFVWMLLVAVGLVLIVARIILEQSNRWLIRMNLISLAATLYVCALINFPAIIADYNVTHSKEASGKGVNLDTNYLYELGPQALPALNRALVLLGLEARLTCNRNRLLSIQAADMASWRSWGFRSWRLQRRLDNHPDQPSNAG
ncbi:MAG TPA: DUF4153 domain-containing protein [Bradyrhizobium sp.]|jgi:hypothetical protein|nr:DUF4153 domain-containing protein [Bradyrhizobium sp.]